MKKFVKLEKNRVFIMLTMLLIIFIFIIIRECDFPLKYNNKIMKLLFVSTSSDKLFYNISISYIAAYIFYIIQIYIPITLKNRNALGLMKENVLKEIRLLKFFLYIFDKSTYVEDSKYVIKQDLEKHFYIMIKDERSIYLKRFTYELSLDSFCNSLKEIHATLCNSCSIHDVDSYISGLLTSIPMEKIIGLLKYICDNKDKVERCVIVNSNVVSSLNKHISLLEQLGIFSSIYSCEECRNSGLQMRYDQEQLKNSLSEDIFTIDVL